MKVPKGYIENFSHNAQSYAWRQLARRAGVRSEEPNGTGFEPLSLPVAYADPANTHLERPGLIVSACTAEDWSSLLQCPTKSIDWVPYTQTIPNGTATPGEKGGGKRKKAQYDDNAVPVLFWGAGCGQHEKPFAEIREDGTLVFYVDILAATFFLLTRWEEIASPERDVHERFPLHASTAHQCGFLDRPLVDEYALILRSWLQVLYPRWQPAKLKLKIKLSHDIDWALNFSAVEKGLRSAGVHLLKRQQPRQAWQRLSDVMCDLVTPAQTQPMQGIHTLARLSEEHGFTSAFYFMAAQPTSYDSGYAVESHSVRHMIERLQNAGHEIGFHPSYYTLDNPALLAQEKERLDSVLGEKHYGGRQHYLRFRAPTTWRNWDALGLAYDSTLGFAEEPGFRCGTCHPFPVFDLERDRVLQLIEVPLIAMDATLVHYQKLDPDAARQVLLALAQRCAAVEGTFTLLWHNTSVLGSWEPWVDFYKTILQELAAL